MNKMTIGLLKRNFSKVMKDVENGEEYTVLYGRNAKPIAKIVPIREKKNRNIRSMGKTFEFTETEDSKISIEEFLGI